jgi:hypothetical protein
VRDRRALFDEIVCEVVVGIFVISIGVQTVLHLLKASVIDVDDIWVKGGSYGPPTEYGGKGGNRQVERNGL